MLPVQAAPPLQDYTADLHALAAMVARRHAEGDVLERALQALRSVVPYDLAAVFRLQGDDLRVVAAAGPLFDPRIRGHKLSLRRNPALRQALERRHPQALREEQHAQDGDPYDGVLDLPNGHSCMVVPLFAEERILGLITLDRAVCEQYPAPQVQLAGVYAQLISLAMVFAEQAALLDRYRHQLREQNRLLLEESGGAEQACQWLEASVSPLMRQVVRLARQVASVEVPVLLLGETGTGKEVLSQAIHQWSARADAPFVKLNCSSIPEHLVESELFGHVKGAFSGADRERRGRFLTANGGTLLLDELGDMPLSSQAKLLRVLQEGTFEPVGSDATVKVDVRIIAATHVNLEEAIRQGRFREDLFYRLAVFPLRVPPLRERSEDIPAMARGFLESAARRSGRGPWSLEPEAERLLGQARWPGNVRELINVLERVTLLQPAGPLGGRLVGSVLAPAETSIGPEAGPVGSESVAEPGRKLEATQAPPSSLAPLPTFEEQERRYLEALLERTQGRLYGPEGAAAIAGLKPTTLRSRLVKLGLR